MAAFLRDRRSMMHGWRRMRQLGERAHIRKFPECEWQFA